MSAPYTQSSGASGPAYAQATPREDPVPTASAGGPTPQALRGAWEAYRGNFKGPLTPLAGQPDLNVLANRCGPIVRTGVDFLFGPVLKLQAKDGNSQRILDAAWGDDDRRMTTLAKTKINGGVYGHVFVKVVTPRNAQPLGADNPPRLVVQNPEMYTVETDPDDCDLVTCYYCTWQGGDGTWHQQRTRRVDPDDGADETSTDGGDEEQGNDLHWVISNWTKKGDGGGKDDWQPDGEPTTWPYPLAPIVDWQNYPNPNDHWGARDVDDSVVNLNKQLHLVESNTNSVMYSHGHPWLFAMGADTGGITPTPGSITDLGGADAKIQAVTATGDIDHMMAFAAQIRGDMDEASSTPGVATGRMSELPKGALAGITVRLLYGPRLMRTEHERRLYGQGIRQLCRVVLLVCGQEAAAGEDVDLTWQDPLPQDDQAMAQMALALEQVGVSKHTVFSFMGLDYETEQEYLKDEAADQLRALAHGQGLPPVAGPMPMTSMGASAGDGMGGGGGAQQQPGVAPNGQMPPVNHPKAIAARAAAKAAGAAMKLGNVPKGAK